MININENDNTESTNMGSNGPMSVSKLKEYGKQAYRPLVDVVAKYQDEFTPYLNALAKGLQSGCETLEKEDSTPTEKYVAHLFREASEGLNEASQKLQSKDIGALSNFLNEQIDKRPSLMFSTSYVAGLFFGRLGRHLAGQSSKSLQ